jgi:HD-like signal output (HDOD) protein
MTATPAYYREKALGSLGELPPFSPILNKLIATLADEDVPFARLAELIEKDSVLAGNVLRLVNSALYGRQGTVSSVRHAVSLIGVVKLRNAAMTFSVSSMWKQAKTPPGWSARRFSLHSTATAIMSDLLAQKVLVNYPEGAFTGGLLHDIGLLLIAVALREEYKQIERHHIETGRPLHECGIEIIGLDYAELSAVILAKWNIPEPIQHAVRHQHTPHNRNGQVALSHVLQIAENLVNLESITIFQAGCATDKCSDTLLKQMGSEIVNYELSDEFHAEFDPIREFF